MKAESVSDVKIYRLMLDPDTMGRKTGIAYISEEGAKIIWAAYQSCFPGQPQTMEQREARGGICWLSEIRYWKEGGHLSKDFNLNDYRVSGPA